VLADHGAQTNYQRGESRRVGGLGVFAGPERLDLSRQPRAFGQAETAQAAGELVRFADRQLPFVVLERAGQQCNDGPFE
jgi:hypothetical protein